MSEMVLIGLGGKAGAGKDTLADLMVSELGFVKLPLARTIKVMLNAMFNWPMKLWDNRTWKETPLIDVGKSPRQLAQTLGTEWGRELVHPDVWLRAVESDPAFLMPRVVIPDIRFENEVKFIHAHKGAVVYIERSDVGAVASHASEQGNVDKLADFTVMNHTTPQHMLDQLKGFLYVRSQS